MPRNLRPAREERAAGDERHVAANRAHDRVRRCDMRPRAQDTTDDQAHEKQQRKPAWNSKPPLCHTKPRRETREALRRKMLCRLTLELSGGVAVRLERIVRRLLWRTLSKKGRHRRLSRSPQEQHRLADLFLRCGR